MVLDGIRLFQRLWSDRSDEAITGRFFFPLVHLKSTRSTYSVILPKWLEHLVLHPPALDIVVEKNTASSECSLQSTYTHSSKAWPYLA